MPTERELMAGRMEADNLQSAHGIRPAIACALSELSIPP
jgi:hypothetical protein